MAVDYSTSPPPTGSKGGGGGVSLAREIGLIGLLWASMGSIIGSGWLFGAQKGLIAAGPAVIISWVIGGICILVLALVHAELGAMYPMSGGSARFPHYAFGGIAGARLRLVLLAAGRHRGAHRGLRDDPLPGPLQLRQGLAEGDQTLTTPGLIAAIVLMAILASVNYLGVKALAATNSAMTWWKVGVPLATIFIVAIAGGLHGSNLHAANGFNPDGIKGILIAIPASGIIFSYLGFEQADQLAGESKNPKRDIPFAVIGSIVLGLIIYIALQVVFLLALPSSAIGKTWDATGSGLYTAFTGPWAQLASLVSLGWLAAILYFDAVDLTRRHRADLHRRRCSRSPTDWPATATSTRCSAGSRPPRCRGSACSSRSWRAASASCRSRAGSRWSA